MVQRGKDNFKKRRSYLEDKMSIPGTKSQTFSTNSLFAAFCLAVIGWGLLHAWGFSLKLGMVFHALVAMPGFVLSGAVIYRYRQHWPAGRASTAWPDRHDAKLPRDYRAVALYLSLIGVGFGMALFINGGSLFILSLAAMGMALVPWTKISVCRDHFYLSSALVEASAFSGLFVLGGPVHPLHYPMAAGFLLTVACILVMSVLVIHGNRLGRMPVSGH